MPRNYYCLVAGLPNIYLDDSKLSYDSARFREDLEREVTPADLKLLDYFRHLKDNRNLLNNLTGKREAFLDGGSFNQEELTERINNPEALPAYQKEFISAFKAENGTVPDNPELLLNTLFFDYLLAVPNKFLQSWFEFELNVRNLLTALNCRKYGLDVESEIVGFNWVANAIRKNSTRDFGLNELAYASQVIAAYESGQLLEREKAVDLMRWNLLDEMVFFHYFTIERLFSYYWKIATVERWLALDPETGRTMFNRLLDDLKKSYEFPADFR